MDETEITTAPPAPPRGKAYVEARIRAAQERQAREAAAQPPAPLPQWSDAVRGVPNSVLRSALFGAIRRGRRVFQQRALKTTVDGLSVLQTGPTLDQADLDVWEQCLHLARGEGLGCRIQFATRAFLCGIGRSTGGKDVEWLKGAFARLAASVVEIKDGKRAYFGPLIHNGTRDDETGHYVIEINPAIAALYGPDGWTQVQWSQRQALRGQPLAQWLHGYYSTHAQPYPVKVETIRSLCGSSTALLKHFRAELREALDKLAAATGWSWEIDAADRVQLTKKPTRSQARHLKKAQAPAG